MPCKVLRVMMPCGRLIHGNQGVKSKDENFASAAQLVLTTPQIMELLYCTFWAAREQLGSNAGGI